MNTIELPAIIEILDIDCESNCEVKYERVGNSILVKDVLLNGCSVELDPLTIISLEVEIETLILGE